MTYSIQYDQPCHHTLALTAGETPPETVWFLAAFLL